MDYQYTFRQAHQDRLEDAGIAKYRPADGFRVLKAKHQGQRTPARQLRPVFAALINLLTK
jgi:hypothetical protein